MPSIKVTTTESPRIEPGVHEATIKHAVEAVSKSGNEMLKLEVKVGPLTFNSWVVFTEKNVHNVVEFAEAVGIKVTEGQMLNIEPHDIVGRLALVNIQPGERISDKTGQPYLEIRNWVKIGETATKQNRVQKLEPLEADEIPF